MKKKETVFVWTGIGVIIVGLAGWSIWSGMQPGKYDTFATCIKDAGAKFYGAFWCSHCQNQKNMFGKSSKLLPYIECSTPDGRSQLQVCQDAKVESYPTWEFDDGTRLTGEVSMEILAEKTACELKADA